MRLRCSKGERAGWTGEAEITADHARSREGVPVLVLAGEPVPVIAASDAGYEIVEATDDERAALQLGGYAFPDASLEGERDSGSAVPASSS